MRPVYSLLLAGAALLFACQRGAPDLPMDEEELIEVLVDVHIAESAIQDLYGTTKDSVGQVYYQQICYIHHIEQSELDTALAILRRNSNYASIVYQKVMQVLEERQAKGLEQGDEGADSQE